MNLKLAAKGLLGSEKDSTTLISELKSQGLLGENVYSTLWHTQPHWWTNSDNLSNHVIIVKIWKGQFFWFFSCNISILWYSTASCTASGIAFNSADIEKSDTTKLRALIVRPRIAGKIIIRSVYDFVIRVRR